MTYQSHQNAIVCLYNLITNSVFSNIIPWFQRYIKHTMCLARQINHVRIRQQVVKGPRSSVLNLMAPCTPQNRTHIYIYMYHILYIHIQISSNHSPPGIEGGIGWIILNIQVRCKVKAGKIEAPNDFQCKTARHRSFLFSFQFAKASHQQVFIIWVYIWLVFC